MKRKRQKGNSISEEADRVKEKPYSPSAGLKGIKDCGQKKRGMDMRDLEAIRQDIARCDTELLRLLEKRMDYIQELTACKRMSGLPLLEQKDRRRKETLAAGLSGSRYKEECSRIADSILWAEKRAKARALCTGNIALIGFMGAGKSTVSHYLRDRLAMEEIETDQLIVEAEGMPIADIFDKHGEAYFRRVESQVIRKLQDKKGAVISCGGGVAMREENVRDLKKSSRIVLLTASPETILSRVKNSTKRPILNGNMNVDYITALMEKRRSSYQAAADIQVATDGKNVAQICEEILQKI